MLNCAGLQKLQARQVDSAKGIFTTPDPNVPTTSQPLPSGRVSIYIQSYEILLLV